MRVLPRFVVPLVTLLLTPCYAISDLASADIFPHPLSVKSSSGQWAIDPKTFVIEAGNLPSGSVNMSQRLNRSMTRIRDQIFDYGPAADISKAQCCGQTEKNTNCTCNILRKLVINVKDSANNMVRGTNEAYNISLQTGSDTATLNASSVFGAIRGLSSFSQMVAFNLTSATYTTFGGTVVDAPRFEFRGVLADTSRNFVSLNELKTLCDIMEQTKMNALHLHLTDDQSWPIEIEGFPLLTQWMAYGNKKYMTPNNMTTEHIYTIADMQELVTYCMDRAVRIIPEVDMPGHFNAGGAYPSYFVKYDQPSGCFTNASLTCDIGLIDVTTEHGFDLVRGIWSSLVSTFPGGEYHIGGDEVWSVPWEKSPAIQNWLKQLPSGQCPDDPKINCTSIGDIQPYFTRRVVAIINELYPGASVMGWNPGIGNFYKYGKMSDKYPNFSYSNWFGWDREGPWQGPMSSMTNASVEDAYAILSGPFYIVEPKWVSVRFPNGTEDYSHHVPSTIPTSLQMMHENILNFTGGNKSKVRGAELVAWGDAAKIDSGNLVFVISKYMRAMGLALWSPNGTIPKCAGNECPSGDPKTLSPSTCNGMDYSICGTLDQQRCRMMMRGIPAGNRERGFGEPCPVPYQRPLPTSWWKSPKVTTRTRDGEDEIQMLREEVHRLRQKLKDAGIDP
eukprot:m.344362 g.344362  ORF g.344362 m.344362 type:complete len:673 (-) comp24269_c0_seq1:85-2103(-)